MKKALNVFYILLFITYVFFHIIYPLFSRFSAFSESKTEEIKNSDSIDSSTTVAITNDTQHSWKRQDEIQESEIGPWKKDIVIADGALRSLLAKYLAAKGHEKRLLGEKLGEEGARLLVPRDYRNAIFIGQWKGKGVFDQLWWCCAGSRYNFPIVVECKGGNGRLTTRLIDGIRYQQGHPQYNTFIALNMIRRINSGVIPNKELSFLVPYNDLKEFIVNLFVETVSKRNEAVLYKTSSGSFPNAIVIKRALFSKAPKELPAKSRYDNWSSSNIWQPEIRWPFWEDEHEIFITTFEEAIKNEDVHSQINCLSILENSNDNRLLVEVENNITIMSFIRALRIKGYTIRGLSTKRDESRRFRDSIRKGRIR